jgi:UDP-glucose 4-epimerase
MGACEAQVRHLDARNEVVTAYSSHEKVKRVFGSLMRNVPLDEGIAKMATWVKTLKSVPQPKRFGHIEVLKNLPPSWAKLA